jgi:LysM repeat protein
MFKRLSFALAAVAAVLVMALVLPALFDGDRDLPPLPRLVSAAGPGSQPVPQGLLAGANLTLATDMPDMPAEVSVYRATAASIPTTPEEALAWAHDFGLPDPRVYRDPREPEAIFVLGSDDRQLTFRQFGPMGDVHYGNAAAAAADGPPLPFDRAAEVALAFLRQHDLLPAAYRVQEPEHFAPRPESPIRFVHIVPELDGHPLVGDRAGMHVAVNPAGQVTYAILNPLTFERAGDYPIKSAQEAYEELAGGLVAGSPFRLTTEIRHPAEKDIQHYRPDPPAYATGYPVTVTGWVHVLVAEPVLSAAEGDGSDVRAELMARGGTQYDLTGPRLAELTGVGYDDVQIQGTVVAQVGPDRWQMEMTDWEAVPQRQPQCLVGTLTLDGDDAWLVTDEGERYRLPDAPDELSDGERIEVWGDGRSSDGKVLDWWGITSPPMSENEVAVGSVSEVVVVEVEVPPDAPTPPPPPTPTPLPRTHIVQEGETLRDIAGQYGVTVDALLAANDVASDEIAVGQMLVILEPQPTPTGPVEAPAATPTPVAPPPQAKTHFEIGQRVEVTGVVHATIYVDGEARRVEALLQAVPSPSLRLDSPEAHLLPCPLSGSADVMEALAQLDKLHVRVRGRLVPSPVGWSAHGLGIEVESFEKALLTENVQAFLGHLDLETLEGRLVMVMTDHATDQRYVVWHEYDPPTNDPMLSYDQIWLAGVVHPVDTWAGLPVLRVVCERGGPEVEAATSADEFPLEVGPQVVDEAARMEGQLQGAFVVDRVELAYYYEPQPGYVARSTDGPTTTQEPPEATIVQPVWVFYGHNAKDTTRFVAYVQAVVEENVKNAVAR